MAEKKQKYRRSRKRVGRRARKKRPGIPQNRMWKSQKIFLHAYKISSNIGKSCGVAGIGRTVYNDWYSSDENFKAEFDSIKEQWVDLLEEKVLDRAIHGTLKPVWQQGCLMGYVRQHDFRREQFLLVAHRNDVYAQDAVSIDSPTDIAREIREAQKLMLESMTTGEERRDVG